MLFLAAVEVLRLIVAAEDTMDKVREQYTFREHVSYSGGYTRDYEVILVNGKPFQKLIARNGKPLPAREQAKVLQAMRRFAGSFGGRTRVYSMKFGPLKDLETTHELSLETGVLTARPKPGNPYLQRLHFDPQSHRLRLQEIEVVDKGSELSPGTLTRFHYNAEGLLTQLEIDFFVKKKKGRQLHTYSGYRKFDAASTVNFEDIK